MHYFLTFSSSRLGQKIAPITAQGGLRAEALDYSQSSEFNFFAILSKAKELHWWFLLLIMCAWFFVP
jgi:hypothetical protein